MAALFVKLNRSSIGSIEKNIAAQEKLTVLLDQLGKDARETADVNFRIQARMLRLTKYVLAVTIVMLFVSIIQYFQGADHDHKGTTRYYKSTQQQPAAQPKK